MKKSFIIFSLLGASIGTTVKAQDSVMVPVSSPSFHIVEFGFRFMPTFSSFDMKTSSGGTVKGEVTLAMALVDYLQ